MKVGDTVFAVEDSPYWNKGDEGRVIEVTPSVGSLTVLFDNPKKQGARLWSVGFDEVDPVEVYRPCTGPRIEAYTAGATLPLDSAARKAVPLYSGPLRYFPAALAGVARVCKAGNDKHNPGEEMHHARGKSTDHADCILRHLVDLSEDLGHGVGLDQNGIAQVDMIAWRALALAQEWHEKNGAPVAPGAKK